TRPRARRESKAGKQTGRTQEIQRLIGRSLRSVIDMKLLGEVSIVIDADVLQADGGTRTAAITGGMIALSDSVQYCLANNIIRKNPIREWLAAVSVGIQDSQVLLDLDYEEDAIADVDMNVVMTESGKLVEVQGTAEHQVFDRGQLNTMLDVAELGITQLIQEAKKA
ncbi:MAG: ribonuclease PH, partial [Candidatus Marinamargulisbacteria bacterium]|nr:ribonuclease PH [Candidatus Marinamargulisbacteria bacterium]